MKLTTAEASLSLSRNLHPFNLLLRLSEMGYAFDDIWPHIEESWIESVRVTDWKRFAPSVKMDTQALVIFAESEQNTDDLGISDGAALVLEKLWRNSKWGHAYVSIEAMQKHTHIDKGKLGMAIQELLRTGLLTQQGTLSAYSLDPGRRSEVERIANIMVRRASD